MGKIIAVNGKGGTGKTTVAALLIDRMVKNRLGRILAIDADPNSTLSDALGIKPGQTIVGVIEEASSSMGRLPAGMTKDRFIELKVQESVIEEDAFDLLVMGRPEGPGCYCYVNNVLRGVLTGVAKAYDFVVLDNAAGMEHISRRTERVIDKFILVSDYTVMGIRSSRRIYDLAGEIDIKIGAPYLIVNKVTGPLEILKKDIDSSGIPLAGTISYSEELMNLGLEGRSISELEDEKVASSIEAITKKILD